jgi:hypothetical protein
VHDSPLDRVKLSVENTGIIKHYEMNAVHSTFLIVRLVRFISSFTVRLASSCTSGTRTAPSTNFTELFAMIVLLMMKDFSKIYFIATYKASVADFFVTST